MDTTIEYRAPTDAHMHDLLIMLDPFSARQCHTPAWLDAYQVATWTVEHDRDDRVTQDRIYDAIDELWDAAANARAAGEAWERAGIDWL